MKKYNTNYKKRVDVERDMYLPRRSPKGLLCCRGCGSVYYRRRWTLTPGLEVGNRAESGERIRSVLCPACRKIHDHFPGGELRLIGIALGEKEEILRLLRNEEKRAREKNPLERIMRVTMENGGLKAETTTEKLAQRLGRSLRKARGGKVSYKWSHNNKYARVVWEKGEKTSSRENKIPS